VAQFLAKKLPPHWVYVPSRRQLRNLLSLMPADVRRIDLDGTGRRPGPTGLLLGYLEQRVIDRAWCFYLRLWGVPTSALGERQDELAAVALGAIRQYMADCLAKPAAEVSRPTQTLLWFALGAGGIQPRCRVKQVDRRSFSAGAWWVSPPRV
jgi:hypothetical protein